MLPAPVPVRIDGQEIATRVMGQGPALVLIHGTPFSSHAWHRIAPVLAVRHTVYMYDLLGYGASAKPAGDVSLGVQNGVLAGLFAHWQLDAPGVIAHDFGGATALRAHLLDGLDYDRLLLIDPVALRPWGSPFVAHVRHHEAAFAGLPEDMHRAMLAAYLRTASHAGLTDAALAPYLAPWLGAAGQAAFYRQIAQMDMAFTDEAEPLYPSLRCPVRLLWGEQDGWIPVVTGDRLAQTLPGCRLVRVPGAGHLVQEDAPEAILAAALDFFG
ncbi:alpha/beta fold hydrolase [Rhodovulum marinum]|uniref:Pimeloyl-ACP methyl ester carboxylesterase n=1 Tax=Rhodovulum marinum TaxID=320662 RepID=A0A4R2PS32_9RHOB|nr:alpha/beta hydrolase [Rhodovulum marinum]TCP38659.1 pimeloyl-ACP methyl ester carboxylesterase [Rhodovulum marinum]